MAPLIGLIAKGISGGIGLASEAVAEHKEKKAAKAQALSPTPSQTTDRLSPSPSTEKRRESKSDIDSSDSDSDDLNQDHADWALDEAGEELDNPPLYHEISNDPTVSPDDLAIQFLKKHPTDLNLQHYSPLPQPVILPQRRPKDKSRGFVRAYAPVLGECSGIDQETFIDFLNSLDKASRASPIFDVINLACFAVGFVPNPIAMGVTIAVQTAAQTAKEIQSRHRRNTYLDQINETMFKPRGLFCMIMAFKPDNPYDPVIGMDVSPHDQALAKVLSTPDSELRQKMKQLRLSSGVTKGEMALPESAPLIFPKLDAAALAAVEGKGESIPEEKKESLTSSGAFMASYFDRRAQAKYASMNPKSKLANVPLEKQFASRFSDPNHPVNSGSIVSLITGGHVNPFSAKRRRKAQRRAIRRGEVLSEAELRNAEIRGKRGQPRKRQGLIRRVIQKDVLYLAIVNLPSESEMMEIRQELERMKSEQSVKGSLAIPGLNPRSRSPSPMR